LYKITYLCAYDYLTMISIPVSTLRDKMKSYLDRVTKSFETIIVSRGSDEDDSVVIMSLKEYNALVETNYLLSSSKNRQWLEESIEQMKQGKVVEPKEFKKRS
jgi:antitoxin YefM